ncbi:Cytochrome P450 3A11 [Chionoecetes opilio]|uniref:Cytochrome P450 3A11 n=1 Tax=Chionoecetes opilio TaxID=41210 RepID=A0A8J4YCT7_CHIOP|nr:Cytochrome P450 3A11 [Chionoecetes opilio]
MGVETWVLVATVAVLAWLYSKWRHSYWSSRGVPSPPALPFLGHYHKAYFMNKTSWVFYNEMYKKFRDASMFGMYEVWNPILVLWDPEIMKHIFIKDFDHFTDRRTFELDTGNEREQMIMEMLTLKNGAAWKSLRAIMTPTFTSGKIKSMFPLVCDKADALVKFSMKQAAENPHVDMKNNFGRFTMDTIASCAFGIECNSLVDKNAEFPRKAEKFFTPSFTAIMKIMLYSVMPKPFKFFRVHLNPPEVDFFMDVIRKTVAARQGGEKRGDFLDLLLEARDDPDNPNNKQVLGELTIVAQSLLFIIAGYRTTAALLSFSSFLLAKNKDQQHRLRDELRQMVAEHGDITYQAIMEAKLLDACLQETLRLYPSGLVLERSCTKTIKLPGTDLTLKPGDLVEVPVWCLHHDPRYWPDPEAFIPDRFLPENKGNIHPFTHMPFGMGPRNCIAMRFALLETKVALAKLLLKAELEVAPGHEEVALETGVNGFIRPKDGIILSMKPVKE